MNPAAFFAQHPLIFHIIIIAVSFVILVKAANLLVFGINRYAKKEGLSDYIIGLLVVSLTASTPEFVSSISGLLAGDEGIIFGTILGSNIAGITLVLGIFALVGRKLKLDNKILKGMEPFIFFLIMLPFILGINGSLSRIDGIILIIVYFAYAAFLWFRESKTGHMKKDVKLKFVWKESLIFLLALAALFLSSRWLVFSAITASEMLKVPTFVMAIVVLGIASSLPDIFVGIKSLLEGDTGVGIGGSLGSMIVKALLFFGILAVIKPLPLDFSQLLISIIITIISLLIVMYLTKTGKMTWKSGLVLLFVYIVYIVLELIK